MLEEKELAEISYLPLEDTFQIGWNEKVIKDGVVLSSKTHHRLYTREQKDLLLEAVPTAATIASAVGW